MATQIADQALIVHLYAPLTGPRHDGAWAQLTRIWGAAVTKLGMVEAIPGLGLPADPASSASDAQPGAIAARTAAAPGVNQAVWIIEHDVACVSLVLSGDAQAPASWSDLHTRWSDVVDGLATDELLGWAEEFTGLMAADDPAPADLAAIATALPAGVLAGGSTWTGGMALCPGGIRIWGPTAATGASRTRRLVIIAPPEREAQLSALCWTRGGTPAMAPLTRLLLHATKLSYEIRVWADGPSISALRRRAEEILASVSGLLADNSATAVADEQLDDAEEAMLRLLSSEAGLVDVSALVRMMRHTVDLATSNITAYAKRIMAGDWDPDGTDLFAREVAAAKWFATQLDDDVKYLDVARERVERLGALAERELRRRQRRREDAGRRRQERFNLLQTAIIGAVVMGLTAVQSLDYKLPVPHAAKPAIVAVLGAATFYLSTVALRLAIGPPRLRSWLPWFEHAAAGSLAAAAVWLIVRWTGADLRGLVLAAWLAVAFALTAAGTAALTARRA